MRNTLKNYLLKAKLLKFEATFVKCQMNLSLLFSHFLKYNEEVSINDNELLNCFFAYYKF